MPVTRAQWMMLWTFLLERFQERGTWAHLANLAATTCGTVLAPEWRETIAWGGVLLASVIGILTIEKAPRQDYGGGYGGYDQGATPGLPPLPDAPPHDPGAP